MTERERAAAGLMEAELEMQRAVAAQLRDGPGSRERLARAKLRMHHAISRGYRALGVPIPESESSLPDYGAGRAARVAIQAANYQSPTNRVGS